MSKRKIEEDGDLEATAAKLQKPDPMPRTQGIPDEAVVVVTQQNQAWAGMPIEMKHLRATQSTFLDEAIDIDAMQLELPIGACKTQSDVLFVFGRYLPARGMTATFHLSQPQVVDLVGTLDGLGCAHLCENRTRHPHQQRQQARSTPPLRHGPTLPPQGLGEQGSRLVHRQPQL